MKGSGGTKPCCFCKNVVGKRTFLGRNRDGYFVTLAVAKYAHLDPHTDESLYEMADVLRDRQATAGKTVFKTLQQAFGLNFAPHSCLFDAALRPHIHPRAAILWDWMHVLVCNGLVTNEAAMLIQVLRDAGVPLEALDAFTHSIHNLKGFPSSRMPCNFFRNRFHSSTSGPSLQAFAKEMMAVACALRLFIEMTLVPRRLLEPYYRCFLYLCTILDIVSLGDKAIALLPFLRRVVEAHHSLFADLYGVDSTVPKHHYTMHLPDVIETLQVNVSAFTVERKHRCAKRIANRVFNNFEHTLAIGDTNI